MMISGLIYYLVIPTLRKIDFNQLLTITNQAKVILIGYNQ